LSTEADRGAAGSTCEVISLLAGQRDFKQALEVAAREGKLSK